MEDADGAQGASQPGSPRTDIGGRLDEASLGSPIGPAMANGNGFLYEHVPAEPESALEAAVQDVVVSDASAGKPLNTPGQNFCRTLALQAIAQSVVIYKPDMDLSHL